MQQILENDVLKISLMAMKLLYLELIYLDMDQGYMYMEEIVSDQQHSKQVHFGPYRVRIFAHYDRVSAEDHE